MFDYISDIAFTPAVKTVQEKRGSRGMIAKAEKKGAFDEIVTPALAEFVATQDMFFLGTANEDGQPYIQYKGGALGFLKVIDEKTLAWADFAGNRQYISEGNLVGNQKAFIFMIDFVTKRRFKLWGTAQVVEDDPELLESLTDAEYPGRVERAVVFTLDAWDANCPQHIHVRYPESEVAPMIEEMQTKIDDLQERLAKYEHNSTED
ncbi:MAG: putative pyridoxine 5'-phosphate oxidase superfamily flavin-nucleotide-binding protein [Planctomycetota bacterium]|jgi:predicted pyridoxine 5'-phosphate oxidase superfamily flavin-nucleotide-binding protein